MQAIYLILSITVAAFAKDSSMSSSTASLVAKLEAERERKRMLINQMNVKDMLEAEDLASKEDAADKTPVVEREVLESQGVLAEAQYSVEDAMLTARNKMTDAEEMEQKAKNMATTIEGVTSKEDKKKLSKLTFESSFLEQESRKKSMRERDTSFVQLEVNKLQKQKQELLSELKKKAESNAQQRLGLETTAQIMKAEAEKELKATEKSWVGVEAVAQANEAGQKTMTGMYGEPLETPKPKHMAPKWMVAAQLEEAMDAQTEEGRKRDRETQQNNVQKSYLWKQMGKKYTCAAEHNPVKAFIIDSSKDRADCLERQLEKYCLEPLRAPAMRQEVVMNLVKQPQDCLVMGVDERVPVARRASVAAKWCNLVQVLQGIAAQPLKQKYFVLLEDHIKVDPENFEEVIKSFAETYYHDWDLLQLDPMGKHNDNDKIASFNDISVYRNSRHGEYLGFNSVLMKTKSAPQILEKMMKMPAVPLDTLPTLLNEQKGKLIAASLAADIVNVPKRGSLLQNTQCTVAQSGLLQLQQMSQVAKPASLLQTQQVAPLDFLAFESQMGKELATKNWENRDLTDF